MSKKTTYRLEENICKRCEQQGVNGQNIQAAHTTKKQINNNNNNPIQKKGGAEALKRHFSRQRHRWPTGTRKDAHHALSEKRSQKP